MNKILIGSQAIKFWFKNVPRNPKDTDYAIENEIDGSTREVEYLVNPILFKYIEEHGAHTVFDNEVYSVLSPNELYTLKLSHLAYHDIGWNKHIFDIQWLKDRGCTVVPNLFYELYDFWNEYFGTNKRSDLEMSADSFFDNALKSEHSHDWLHTLLANPPTYTKILKDGAEVDVCQEKFNNLSFEEKCSLVREEVMIMAWERAPTWNYRRAYETMLRKFIISHAPIWESLFILDNFKSLYRPEFNYFEFINKKLEEHAIRY